MFRLLDNVKIDWLAKRKAFLLFSTVILFAGLASAVGRQFTPGGTDAFNLGVDFRGGTLVTVNFKQRPTPETIREALTKAGIGDATIQPALDRNDQVLIKIAQQGSGEEAQSQAQVDIGQTKVREALAQFGKGGKLTEGAEWEIVATDAVGPVAGRQLRNQAVTVTLLALVGILLYIAFRYEWTYGASAVITVFHDVLVTLAFFSIFQIEVNLTVVAALLTLVGFSVNDTIVTFDRVRENLRLHRRTSLYDITNEAINQTLSRTVITSGLVFLSVVALVFFGGEVLRPFSLALLIGVVFGTYSTIAISNPIMVWWQQRIGRGGGETPARSEKGAKGRPTQSARNARAAAR
jgi:preprotein translocase subunit SecF